MLCPECNKLRHEGDCKWTDEQRFAQAQSNSVKRMDYIDHQPQAIRELVHEYGWSVVKAFLDCGVSKPKQIRHLIRMTLEGSYDGGQNPLSRENADANKAP